MKHLKWLLFVLVVVCSTQIRAESVWLKIFNPSNDSEVYVLTYYPCKNTVQQSHSNTAQEFGLEVERKTYTRTTVGCYDFNDKEKVITFLYKDGKVVKVPYAKIKTLDIDSGKPFSNHKFFSVEGRKVIEAEQGAQMTNLRNQSSPSVAQQPQPASSTGRVIGTSFDSQANGNIFLYDGACQLSNYSSGYPLRWDAKRADNGELIGEGCYSYNQQSQQVFIIASTGKTASLPMSAFQGGQTGESKSAFQSFSEGLQRATTYWNNSANETQRNTTNLTPSFGGGGRGMNCTPDGRGGYNCK